MEFAKKFYAIIQERCREWGGRRKLATQAGITEDSLNKILSNRTKDPGLSTVSAIVDAIGLDAFMDRSGADCASIRRELSRVKELLMQSEHEKTLLQGRIDELRYQLALERGHAPQEKSWPTALSSGNQDVG